MNDYNDAVEKAHRLHGENKQKRDLLIYLIWNTGLMTNDAIGKQFGMSYSAVSHSVKSFKEKIGKDKKLRNQFRKANSQFKI